MTTEASEILSWKRDEGKNAYLWVHSSGDVILWASEESSENDSGVNAIKQWQVDHQTVLDLIDSGEVNCEA